MRKKKLRKAEKASLWGRLKRRFYRLWKMTITPVGGFGYSILKGDF